MPLFHLRPPLFLLGPILIGLSLHLGLEPLGSKVLTLAAAEQADQESNDDNPTDHCQGDYQRLEVHPAEPPACIIQWADGVGWEDGPHWIRYTRLSCDAPQTRHISQTFLTVCAVFRLTHVLVCGRLGENCRQAEDKKERREQNP